MSKRRMAGGAGAPDFPLRWLAVRGRLTRLLAVPVAAGLVGALLAMAPATRALAACANPVACENQLPGTPQSGWDVTNPSTTIQGFADPFSVNVGGSIIFKINSPATIYAVDIYRMGYYGAAGARMATSLIPNILVWQSQPACNTNTVFAPGDCVNRGVSPTCDDHAAAISPIYLPTICR